MPPEKGGDGAHVSKQVMTPPGSAGGAGDGGGDNGGRGGDGDGSYGHHTVDDANPVVLGQQHDDPDPEHPGTP